MAKVRDQAARPDRVGPTSVGHRARIGLLGVPGEHQPGSDSARTPWDARALGLRCGMAGALKPPAISIFGASRGSDAP